MAQAGKAAETPAGTQFWNIVGFLVAAVAVAGSLYLSLQMNLKACPLCLYQRTFVFGASTVLLVGLFARPRPSAILSLLALPLSVAGTGVAVFHVYLEWSGKLECPKGISDIGTAPQQALAAQAGLTLLLIVGAACGYRFAGWLAALLLGVVLSVAAIYSAPPLPPAPTKAYDKPLDMCRPPYHAP